MTMQEAPFTLLERVDSTNTQAMLGAREGLPHGSAWLAEQQTQGRGRRHSDAQARAWHSPPGVNIYMSVLLRPKLDMAAAAGLTLAVAAHIAPYLRQETGVDLWVKWPNDLYVGRRKLAGILSEAYTSAAGLEAVVIGLGLNVNLEREALPPELADQITSLSIEGGGQRWDRLRLCLGLRHAILSGYEQLAQEGLGPAIERLAALDYAKGSSVSWSELGKTHYGVADGLDEQGHLMILNEAGQRISVHAGEVRFDLSTMPPQKP